MTEPADHPPEVLLPAESGPRTASDDPGEFDRAIADYASVMRRTLDAAMRSAASWRERDLLGILGLDRSLVGRLVRAARMPGDLAMVQELPSPDGMTAILNALRDARLIGAASHREATRTLERFEAFVDTYPGKRRAVMVRLASQLPSERSTLDRRARRAMYQAASDLLGYRVRHAVVTLLIVDGVDPERFDTLYLFSKFGLERTRADGPPIIVSSLRTGAPGTGHTFAPIDPARDPTDPTAALLEQFSTGPARIQFVDVAPQRTELHISADTPPLHHPIDVLCAQRADAVILRYRNEQFSHEWRRTVSRLPAERVSIDLVLGPGVFPKLRLAISEHLFRTEVPPPPGAQGSRADRLPEGAILGPITQGIASLALDDTPAYEQALRTMLAHAGVDPERCRSARITKDYPELNSELICWLELPRRSQR